MASSLIPSNFIITKASGAELVKSAAGGDTKHLEHPFAAWPLYYPNS